MNNLRKIAAGICSLAMAASMTAMPYGTLVNAEDRQMIGETNFDYKILPWHFVEQSPAKQRFEIEDGTLHVRILYPTGADKEKWDLQLRHRGLDLREGHTYTVSFKAKAKRNGMQLCSSITNIKGDEEYCVLNLNKMETGRAFGGLWGKAAVLTDEWQTITGEFTPTRDIDACEWHFSYAKGSQYEGNAEIGDEIWFDDMSLIDLSAGTCPPPFTDYGDLGAVSRSFSGLENNYISVNQVGYFPERQKIAVLGDNAGDILHGTEKIKLTVPVDFEVVNAKTGDTVFSGTSTKSSGDADSGDMVCKLDFTELREPGTYYIKAGDYRSFEFKIGNDIYSEKDHNLFTDSMNYFYQNRSGIDITEEYITSGERSHLAHRGGHYEDKAKVQKIWNDEYASKDEASVKYASSEITATGGWYEAGNHAKYVVGGGISAWMLQNMYERTVNVAESSALEDKTGAVYVPEAGNCIPDVLDEAAYEIDWMAQMKVEADEPEWGGTAEGLYYHKLQDHKWTGLAIKPWDYISEWDTVRIVKPPTFAATLNYAACAAQAARLWAPYDSARAKTYLKSAIDAYKAYKAAYYEADTEQTIHPYLGVRCAKEEINEKSLYAPKWQAKGGNPYGDTDVSDEAYWAACELYISASEMGDDFAAEALKELESYDKAYDLITEIESENINSDPFTSFNWGNTGSCGTLSLALHSDLLSDKAKKKVEDAVVKAAKEYIETEKNQGYGLPYIYDSVNYDWLSSSSVPEMDINGYDQYSNLVVLNNAVIMAYAYDLTGEGKYIDGVTSAMDYLLGTNPLSFSFITGYGDYCLKNPYHRYWCRELDRELPAAPDGVITGGPNAGLQDPYVKGLGFVAGKPENPSQRCFADSVEAWSVNEPSTELNASLAWVAAFLEESAGDGISPVPPVDHPTPDVTPSPIAAETPAITSEPPLVIATPDKTPTPDNTPAVTTVASPDTTPEVTTEASPDVSSTAVISAPEPIGDITLDGIIDITDLTTLAISLVDKEPLGVIAKKNADVNKDGKVDLADLATLRMFLSKKIDRF